MAGLNLNLTAKLNAITEKPRVDLSKLSANQLFIHYEKQRIDLINKRIKATSAAVAEIDKYHELKTDAYIERFKKRGLDYLNQIDAMDKVLSDIAIRDDINIPIIIQWNKWKVISSDEFITRVNCNGYAKEKAEMIKECAIDNGIPARVKIEFGSNNGDWLNYQPESKYTIEVQTTQLGCRILDYRYSRGFSNGKTQSIKQWLQSILKKGMNPFVLNPFLPREIIERNGLDWFGNEISK